MNDLYIIIGNFIAYVLLTIFLWQRKSNAISVIIAIVWSLSAFASVLFFAVFPSPFRDYSDLSIIALVFVFFCFTFNLFPIAKLENPNIVIGNRMLLKALGWFICALGILPFLGNTSYFLTHLTSSLNTFGEHYGENFSVLSGFVATLGRYSNYLRLFAPCLLFLFLDDFKRNKLLCIGLLCCCLNAVIANLNAGSRYIFVLDVLYMICVFILFKKCLSESIVKKIKIIGIIILSILLVVFVSISTVKTSDNTQENAMEMTYSLYAGESFLNFSGSMWKNCQKTYGDNSFYIFKYILGEYPTELRNWSQLSSKSGIPANIFYTYIGDFYMDFGHIGALLIVLLITLFLYFVVKKANETRIFYYYIWIGFILRVLVSGFTYWPYLNGCYEMIYTPIALSFIQFLDDNPNDSFEV